MTDTTVPTSYSRKFALRQPPEPKRAANGANLNVKKRLSLKEAAPGAHKGSLQSQKTLVDALKQHGMRLCDGTRLNAVGKGVHVLGRVPSSVCASVSALYLSQNNLRTLDGVEQFAAVRLLSVGGNLLASDREIARLEGLVQLRNLNLTGNPLCDQPNYRLRVVAMLKRLQVLDNSDITKKERDAAPHVAAQDDALRTMVTQNHFDIQKLQRIALVISLHKGFYGHVMAGVAAGRFDRVPSPTEVACNVSLCLRLWKYEVALSEQEQETLKLQMLTIIIRTHAKLAENPKIKAKEYLLKLANGSSPRAQRQDSASNDLKQRCASWEEAYGNVIALQQKTIANLHAVCEKNRREMVEFLKELLAMDPKHRKRVLGDPFIQQANDEPETKLPARQTSTQSRSWEESRVTNKHRSSESVDMRSSQHRLPPQQQDPDVWDTQTEMAYSNFLPPSFSEKLSPRGRRISQYSRAQEIPAQSTRDRKANLRSGDFANKSLGEAIQSFKLRDSTPTILNKPTGTMPLPSKIPQVHHIYTVCQENDIVLPPDITEKRRPPRRGDQTSRQLAAPFRNGAREMNLSRRDTDLVTEISFNHPRVSSTFTREDLDMTSISAISHASSSPPRTRRLSEEVYITVAKSPPNPLSEVVVQPANRPQQATQTSQSTHQIVPDQHTSVPVNDNRLQELEQREEKYIRALMQSEQRELDLRNNLSTVQRKLASYQRTLAQQLHEREAIKEEMTQRTMAVAAPKILKRFFIKWIQFYNWSQQIKHVQRKRCFIVQHDRFWTWRRKVWMQQELTACVKKQQLRTRKLHFMEWVNFTRVSIIAKRSAILRESRVLKVMFRAWIDDVSLRKRAQKLLLEQQTGMVHRTQRSCFREWKRITRHKRALKRVQDLRWQDSLRVNKQVVFWRWKLFLYSIARPLQERSAQLQYRVECRWTRTHFREWRKLVEINKIYNTKLCRRVWRRWIEWRRRVETEKDAAHKEKIAVVKVFFTAWHVTASEQATSRRSLNLAKRYVNRRRLRKLWMHWKYFSMARRKYTQDSTKALKHYFIKLLRASWGSWKERTHTNLKRAKTKKYGALQRHFDAFRTGIRLVRTQKIRARMLSHAKKRRQWSLLRRVLGSWRRYALSKKRCKRNSQIVANQRKQTILDGVWRNWRSLHVEQLYHQMKTLQKAYDTVLHEKHELEAHLEAAKDTAVSLSDQIEILHERSKGDDKQVVNLEQHLRGFEERNALLENELKSAREAIEQERHAWEEALCDEEDKRESDSKKYRSLAQEYQVLQVQIIKLKSELDGEKAGLVEAEKVNKDLRAASVETSNCHHAEVCASVERQKQLEQEVAQLREHLKEQETEREDTANRLQEYENRIASTCEAMNEHEQAHERENERLRNESANIEAKWKEEQVKTAELRCLLQEKNQLILNMTHRTNFGGECSPHTNQQSVQFEHNRYGELSINQVLHNGAELNMVAHSCSRHPAVKPIMKARGMDHADSVRTGKSSNSGSSCVVKRTKLVARSSNRVRSTDKYTKSDELESPTDAKSIAEEVLIDKHTSKVHEDIRLLQERISKRLEQAPAYAQLPPQLAQRTGRSRFPWEPISPISSSSALSDEDSDTTDEHQAIENRVRRARLRRIQAQKEALILAVAPAMSRLPPKAQSSNLKSRERENISSSANSIKRKGVRKTNNCETTATRSALSKVPEKKKGIRKRVATCTMDEQESSTLEDQVGAAGAENHELDTELTLTVPSPESPTNRTIGETSSRSPKRSPRKQHENLLNIDPTATLAAISARLAIVIPPAESEIARINREALAAVTTRAFNAKNQGTSSPTGPNSPGRSNDAPATISDSTSSSSPSSKGGMTPALYDSVIAEEWVNLHLETSGAFLLPASDIASMMKSPGVDDDDVGFESEAFSFRKGGDGGPLARAGMDRFSLYRMGMPKDLVDRLYRALYVYTNGFHNVINEIAAHCPPGAERHVSSNAWLTFLLLLEQCENGKYEMAMLKFNQAAQNSQKQLQEIFQQEKRDLEARWQILHAGLVDETARGAEKSELIQKLVTETTEANIKIAEQQHHLAAQAEQIRLLKLEVLVHEDEERKLNEFLDDARRDYEVANSERLNALSERYALDEEIRKLSGQCDRVEAEKANYAKRMHETLFMNQALRATNDVLKQDIIVLGMEKDKVIAEKLGLQEQLERAQAETAQIQELKVQVDKELLENKRMQGHLEARLQTMKEQYEIEVDHGVKHQQQILRLRAQIDEERVQTSVLEAKCNLLSSEKQVTGMRAQDKLRIEKLLNQKMELEAIVEANKIDRKRDEEQIYNLRTSLEALDAETQHSKRVYSAGQQAFLHSERTCEQLRQQTQELEKNYEKAKKNVASLKERFKVYEATSKEQTTKLEVEVKVANAQLREITYVNRDNAAQIDQLTKSLSVAEKETTVLKTRVEESEKHVEELETEKEDLQRNKTELALANSSSKNSLNRFILSLQNMLALVKLDEFPLDEAIRELLQMVMDTFGEDLELDHILDEDDKPVDIELEVQEDVTEEERASRHRRAAARRKGIITIEGLDNNEGDGDEANELMILNGANGTGEQATCQREVMRMSRFRKSKLDHLVNKLQREIALKADLITSLERVVCEHLRQISHLTTTTKQQARVMMLYECQKGMLSSDLETTTLMLLQVRNEKQEVEFTLEQVRIDQVLQTNRAFQAEVALATLRREFDKQVIANEDLMGKIWRKYEYDLYMRSLRRNKEVQATVTLVDQNSQTLVPQRNPAMERPRVTSLYIPTDASGAAETLLQKISRATRELLPGVAHEMDVHFTVGKPKAAPTRHQSKQSLVRPLDSSPRSSRTQLRAQVSHEGARRRRRGKPQSNTSGIEAGMSALPLLDDQTASSPTQIVRHVNEFGTRQDVFLSPARPPFFNATSTARAATMAAISPRPPAPQSPRSRKSMPRKLSADKRGPVNLQLDTQFEERVETAGRQSTRSPISLPMPLHTSSASNLSSSSTLRYNRSFLRAGMEVLRNSSSSGSPLPYPDDEPSVASSNSNSSEDEDDESLSPSRLARAVSGYNRDQLSQQEVAWQSETTFRRVVDQDKQNDNEQFDSELFDQDKKSPFTPAVLYPILPNQ